MAWSKFLLFKRFTRKKSVVYYCKSWQPVTNRYDTPKSTAVIAGIMGIDTKVFPPSSKAGARHIAEAWYSSRGNVSRKNDPLLSEYCLGFWDWNTSEYVKGKLERGQQISQNHCASAYYRVREYIQPRTKEIYLSQVTAGLLDSLQLRLKKELLKQSAKSINAIMSAVNLPIREAFRLGKIPHNPAANFRNLNNNSKRRGILSNGQIKEMFNLPFDTEAHRLAIATAIVTGMRLGEILALKITDMDFDFQGLPVIWVRNSWAVNIGLKSTKTGNIRVIPISGNLRENLLRYASGNPHGNGFIFYSADAYKPLSAKVIERGFCNQLKKIGINDRERKEKGLCFHSLRHGFNSALRGKVSDGNLRLATGHLSKEMTDNYDHLTDERLAEIRQAQDNNIVIFKAG
jgi:integrase